MSSSRWNCFQLRWLPATSTEPCAGAYHAFDFGKYATRYLGAIAYRFNRRFRLDTITQRLLVAAAATGPRPEHWLRQAGVPC
jgi:hypothetical protein